MLVPLQDVTAITKAAKGFRFTLRCGHVKQRDTRSGPTTLYCVECPKRWSLKYDKCSECEKTSKPHASKGMCKGCYERKRRGPAKLAVKNRRYNVNDTLFDKWDERSAYLLGVLHADGWISKTTNQIAIGLSGRDHLWLTRLAELIGFAGKINTYTVRDKYAPRPAVRFTFASPRIHEAIRRLGIKTPDVVDRVPTNVFNHFVRGFFDGDGSVFVDNQSGNIRVNFANGFEFLTKLQTRLMRLIGTSDRAGINSKPNCPSSYSLTYAVADARRLNEYMYDKATVFLYRKKAKFQEGGVSLAI